MGGCICATPDPDQQRQSRGRDYQLQRGRETLTHFVNDRAMPADQRISKMKSDHIAKEFPILDSDGLVESEFLANLCDFLRTALGTQGGTHRVARQNAQDEENQRGQDKDHRQG